MKIAGWGVGLVVLPDVAGEDAVAGGDEEGGAPADALQGGCVVASLGGEALPDVGVG